MATLSSPSDNNEKNLTRDEENDDVEKVSKQPGIFSRARLLGPVDREYGDIALLACCLVTGMVDAAVFSNWGLFVGMQTGNTVILGLSASGLPDNPYAWLTTLVSLLTFLLGAFLAFRLTLLLSPTGLCTSRLLTGTLFTLQGLLIILSAALATPSGLIPQNPAPSTRQTPKAEGVERNILIVALIPPLAFQAGMQIATSRLLGFNELPVNVVTSTYCDIMGDPKLFLLQNVKRNRRVAAAMLLLVGAIVSGFMMRSSGGLASVFWLSGGIKVLAGLGVWVFMPAAKKG